MWGRGTQSRDGDVPRKGQVRSDMVSATRFYICTDEFGAKYDACAFDPTCDRLPLTFFEPMVRRAPNTPKYSQVMKHSDTEPRP